MPKTTSTSYPSPDDVPAGLEKVIGDHLQAYFTALDGSTPPASLYKTLLAMMERPLIIQTLALTKGNQLKAAALLGINRNTLHKKLAELNIGSPRQYRHTSAHQRDPLTIAA